ncbi:GAF domain-containing protein [Marinobacter sp. JSM 1782161]|uniref:GAF domain-containing protein n=1 Tax=Marinobacter sp. JSM 1782161 TaxID=2685906 RepID=UPI0014030404|nr:GAF domain-containing protein [Marinobacter sp. JSM 1782161]
MKAPPLAPDEPQRIDSLRALRVLDTPVEERFERITRLAQKFYGVAIAAITLVDEDRQWFKSIQGLEAKATERRVSFCGHALLEDDIFVVEDTLRDERFDDNPLVAGPPHIRFYAGLPLRVQQRIPVGTLCVIDSRPHATSEFDFSVLRDLAALAEREFAFESPANRRDTIHGGPRENLLDEVTGLWNWAGITRQLEESTQRIKMIGGEITLVWLRVTPADTGNTSAEADNAVRRDWSERLLGALDFFDTVGTLDTRDFLLMVHEGERAQLLVRLGMVANRLTQNGDPAYTPPHHLAFAALKTIDGRMGVAEILEQLEKALPEPESDSGTLVLMNGRQRSRIPLL